MLSAVISIIVFPAMSTWYIQGSCQGVFVLGWPNLRTSWPKVCLVRPVPTLLPQNLGQWYSGRNQAQNTKNAHHNLNGYLRIMPFGVEI